MDRLTEMEAFATVVDQGGFTDAAKKMGISKSAVSKHVSALEARLGARLLNRTTRRVSPTEIGLAYYDRARRVLNDAGEADALVTSMQSAPSGLLRISVATDFGVNLLSPILGDFLLEYPDITVNMVLNNRYVELISEGFDMAIRVGELEDSTLRARKLTDTAKRMIGSPAYFQKYGRPQKIDDLNEHKLLHYSNQASGNVWKITAPSGEKRQVRTAGWLTVNDGQSLLQCGDFRSRNRLPAIVPLCRCHEAGSGRRGHRRSADRDAWASMRSIRRAASRNRRSAHSSISWRRLLPTRGRTPGASTGGCQRFPSAGRGQHRLDPSVFPAPRFGQVRAEGSEVADTFRRKLRWCCAIFLNQAGDDRIRPAVSIWPCWRRAGRRRPYARRWPPDCRGWRQERRQVPSARQNVRDRDRRSRTRRKGPRAPYGPTFQGPARKFRDR